MEQHIPKKDAFLFWKKYGQPIFDPIINSRYHLLEIQERYIRNTTMIRERYGKPLNRTLSDEFAPGQELAGNFLLPFSATFAEDCPTLTIFVPAFHEVMQSIMRHNPLNFAHLFEMHAVIGFMHEIDHLAYGLMGKPNDPPEKVLEDESAAWAETCEYTIAPLIEKHCLEVHRLDRHFYDVWVKVGRNPAHNDWREAIHTVYHWNK